MPSLDVVVIGAGPYGLSLGAYLQAKNASHRVFGVPMESWRERMPKGMLLKSDPFASSLYDPASRFTLEAYCRARGIPYEAVGWRVPLGLFVDYGSWFQANASPCLDPRLVVRLEKGRDAFELTLEDGAAWEVRRVVVCVGITHFAHVPAEFAGLPSSLVSHSSQQPQPDRFAGRDVTVLGAGASAIELAALLCEAGARVRLVTRAPALKFASRGAAKPSLVTQLRRPSSGLGAGWSTFAACHFPGGFRYLPDRDRVWLTHRVLGPAAGWGVRERLDGKAQVLLEHRIDALAPVGDGLRLSLVGPAGPCEVDTDHLILGTGYRTELSRLAFLAPAVRQEIATLKGAPRLDARFQSSVPNLFFAGLSAAYTFGPLQRFAFGARFAAETISRALIGNILRDLGLHAHVRSSSPPGSPRA
jgi:lysine/ornithine N-monooxygenase